MNLLINLIPIKKGGGQQVATNFIKQILKDGQLSLTFVTTKNTYVHKLLVKNGAKVLIVNNNLLSRLIFTIFRLPNVIQSYKIDVIYTMFGPGLHYKNVLSITGCAYSNLFFPEIKFWNGYSFIQRLKLYLIDRYRLKSTLKSTAIIFENKAMQLRAFSLYKYPLSNTKLILPSISEYEFIEDNIFFKKMLKIKDSNFNILMLSSWHKNKNLEIIPDILLELKNNNETNISFLLSVSSSHPESINLLNKAKLFNVHENLIFIDNVEPHLIPLLFSKVHGVGLFSLLESFSNNIIESWYFNKPLFISDAEWSRSICNDAAIYVNRKDAKDISSKILNYRSNETLQKEIEFAMHKNLREYPTPKEKVDLQVEFIKQVYNENRS